jgi:protein-S-isoprenylcysteine O-methyltransferase Ste14
MNENFFHWIFVLIFISFTAVRAYYQRQASLSRGSVQYKEGKLHIALRLIFGIPFMLVFLVYMVRPSILSWANLDFPAWLQWTGVILGLASLPLIVWVQQALGSNFSTTLHVREEHTLVTQGPYRWVRHPMYTVLYVHFISILLLTQNWFIGGVFLMALTLIVFLRIRNEEAAMIEKFGEGYRAYILRTGRFLPRFVSGLKTRPEV